ncbi:hypothetical protein [Helicobacter enhydrae]|uniref:hypothetical protein n=1 Tax=Helicobacter enhydrae TaxID=222136 RepID=UPI000A04ED92|nr:hypothetical protein [Helicobacter enhydrae]
MLEAYFKNKLKENQIFSDDFKQDWDNQDIAKYIFKHQQTLNFKEEDIKSMFLCRDIWNQINEDNMQSFDEIKEWFETIKKFFDE